MCVHHGSFRRRLELECTNISLCGSPLACGPNMAWLSLGFSCRLLFVTSMHVRQDSFRCFEWTSLSLYSSPLACGPNMAWLSLGFSCRLLFVTSMHMRHDSFQRCLECTSLSLCSSPLACGPNMAWLSFSFLCRILFVTCTRTHTIYTESKSRRNLHLHQLVNYSRYFHQFY